MRCRLWFRRSRLFSFTVGLLILHSPVFGQAPKRKAIPPSKPAPIQRLSFPQAQQLLMGESEGNMGKRMTFEVITYSLTRLRSGQVLELFYPVTPNQPVKAPGKNRSATVPGYGVLYESETVYVDATRPRHALEDLIPDGRAFVADIPQLVARLEKRLRVGAGKLDYSRASLRKLDVYVASYRSAHPSTDTDPQLFQELAAYYGETLRRALNGEWNLTEERVGKTHRQTEPNLRFFAVGAVRSKLIKPWSSVLNTLYDEERRSSVTKAFDADLAAAQ